MDVKIPSELLAYKRKAWKPITMEGDGSPASSKFAGTPLLAEGEQWPRCGNCNKPLQLFLQLNMVDAPEEAQDEFGKGILQFFYCTSTEPLCDVDAEAWAPFSRSTLVRMLDASQSLSAAKTQNEPVENAFPPRLITAWQIMDDYPNSDEGSSLGIELDKAEWARMWEVAPVAGDKLAGWPAWVQGIEYPDCPVCRKPMRLFFQVDSEDNIPYMFGDAGCGHITQCKQHKDQLAFGWACA